MRSGEIPERWPTGLELDTDSRRTRAHGQTDEWEVNVRASIVDLLRLRDIRSADGGERRSIQVGESAGAPVFWTNVDDHASLMIGHDDETWDIALADPVHVVDEIILEAERL